MKKTLTYIAGIAAIAFAVASCESRLDIPQKGVVSIENFYKTDKDAESALTAAYSRTYCYYNYNNTIGWNDAPHLAIWTYASDDIYAAGNNASDNTAQQEMNSYRFDNNNANITASYQSYYVSIYACNLVIDNFAGDKGDTQTKQRCVAEARILRAYDHLMLALGWGTAPIIDHVIGGDEKPANAESQEQVLKWVVNECDLALADNVLAERKSVNDKDATAKVTKAFAQAVKGKALLSLKDWAGAQAALKPIVEATDKYELVASDHMVDLFHLEGDGNSESIFELNYVYGSDVPDQYNRSGRNLTTLWNWRMDKMYAPTGTGTQVYNNGWGEVNPTKKFVETLIANDGVNSARRKAWIKSYEEVLYEMPYTNDADCPTRALKEADKTRGIWAGDGLYGHCGWFMWKRNIRPQDMSPSNQRMYNFPIMRLPEVLLMYAEACAMQGDADGSGLKALNRIQKRAQSAHISTKCEMSEVKTEKYLECWLECTRLQDLRRWGDGEKELGDNGTYYPSYCDAMFTKSEAKHRGYVEEANATWCKDLYTVGFKTGKHELFPFPFAEMQLNPNLVQNPGY